MHAKLKATLVATLVAFVSAGAAVAAAQIGQVTLRPDPGEATSTVVKAALPAPSSAGNAALSAAEKNGIKQAVRLQLRALAAQDAERAFARLAPSTQRYFGKADRYWQTLAEAVPPILATRQFTFLGAERNPSRTWQQVLIADGLGRQWLAEFQMERQDGGDWLVKGCVVEPAPGQQA